MAPTDFSVFAADLLALCAERDSAVAALGSVQAQLDAANATIIDVQARLDAALAAGASDAATIADLRAQLAAVQQPTTPPPPPPPPAVSLPLGVYGSPGISADAAMTAAFGVTGMRASYYQPAQGVDIVGEAARVRRGQSPLITLTLKTGTPTLNDVANQTPAGLARIDAYIASLEALAAIDPAVPVYATLDHEFEVKVNQGTITGVTTATYGKALSVFIARCKAQAPAVRTLYWFGGSDKTKIGQVFAAITTAPWGISYDPYVTSGESASQSFTDNARPVLDWIKANADYVRLGSPPIGLSEFGMATAHGEAAVAAFLTNIKPQMATLGLAFANYFNSTGTVGTLITGGGFPLSVAALKASAAA